MASKYSKRYNFANEMLAKQFIESKGLTEYYMSPWNDAGEVAVLYNETPPCALYKWRYRVY